MKAIWNSWVESPKSMDVENFIRKYCISNNILIHSLYSKDVGRDIFDKMLGISRESVYFNIEGDYNDLNRLRQHFIDVEKQNR